MTYARRVAEDAAALLGEMKQPNWEVIATVVETVVEEAVLRCAVEASEGRDVLDAMTRIRALAAPPAGVGEGK